MVFLASAFLFAAATEPVLLQWGAIDTSAKAAQEESDGIKASFAKKTARLPAGKADGSSRAAYLVQFEGAIRGEWRDWLESATQVRGYIPENAYIVWATAVEMESIASHDGVHWIGAWKKEYKTVRVAMSKAPSGTARWMHVKSFLAGDDGAAGLRARLEALGAAVRFASPRLDGSVAVASLADAQVDEVSSWPDVEWVEPKAKPRLLNDKAVLGAMMNVVPAWRSVNAGGLGLTGAGQTVAVADTGCDIGVVGGIHADFAGRVLAGYGWADTQYSSTTSWADAHGHGTHCCGSVLGSGAMSGGQYKGVAYEATLVVQGCQEDLSGLADDIRSLFSQAYDAGARIHSDSWGWGSEYAGQYIYDAIDADEYMWSNQNFLGVFAAGNDGADSDRDGVVDPGSVVPPSTAKNGLSVGASENYRDMHDTWRESWPSLFPVDPIASDDVVQTVTPQGMAAFSSRGPTADGRIKPDVVAPGTYIVSVRGRIAKDKGWGVLHSNTNYMYMGGTSMATPLVAGAVALVRQWLVERRGMAEPPAALMKALLVNGARDMTPGQYGTGAAQEITARPDRSQGFGHVDLYDSLEPGDGNFLGFATGQLAATGNSFTTNLVVRRANAERFSLTLAWQDYPGSAAAHKALVNDLDLTVTSPTGRVLHPNNGDGGDHLNNVEFIEFLADEAGEYEVKVKAYRIARTNGLGAQPYALVVRSSRSRGFAISIQ